MGSYADFTGTCGETGTATSTTGLHPGQTVRLNGNTDLCGCIGGHDGACITSIQLLAATNPLYQYALNVDGQGPSGIGSGSLYIEFTDQADDTYALSLYSSARKMHTISYNSAQPAIMKFQWRISTGASQGHIRQTSTGKTYETSLDIR